MTDSNLIFLWSVFAGGLFSGVLLTLLFNKLRSGNASPATIKRELEDYQQQVEAHFDQASDKFKAMAEQYTDLYQHLSVGATSLCRPDHMVPGLTGESDPLQAKSKKLTDQTGKQETAENPDKTKKHTSVPEQSKQPADSTKPVDQKPADQKPAKQDKPATATPATATSATATRDKPSHKPENGLNQSSQAEKKTSSKSNNSKTKPNKNNNSTKKG